MWWRVVWLRVIAQKSLEVDEDQVAEMERKEKMGRVERRLVRMGFWVELPYNTGSMSWGGCSICAGEFIMLRSLWGTRKCKLPRLALSGVQGWLAYPSHRETRRSGATRLTAADWTTTSNWRVTECSGTWPHRKDATRQYGLGSWALAETSLAASSATVARFCRFCMFLRYP